MLGACVHLVFHVAYIHQARLCAGRVLARGPSAIKTRAYCCHLLWFLTSWGRHRQVNKGTSDYNRYEVLVTVPRGPAHMSWDGRGSHL